MTIGLHVHRPASYNSSAMPIKLFTVVQLHAFVDKFDHVYKQRVTFQS